MAYYEFIFDDLQAGQKDILVALLSDNGFEGFEEEDVSLKAFVKDTNFNESEFDEIIIAHPVKYKKSVVADTNWNEKWERDFEPVSVMLPGQKEPFAFIRAFFHQPDPTALHDILITPKMSFGTGHHATTHLMIELMSELDFVGKKVIDFGTGTGILAILAEKLGAGNIIAIDNDEWSINNATENIQANNCTKVRIVQADTLNVQAKAAIFLANINLNVIKVNLHSIQEHCNEGSTLLFSGMIEQDESAIQTALKAENIHIKKIIKRNNWLAIMAVL